MSTQAQTSSNWFRPRQRPKGLSIVGLLLVAAVVAWLVVNLIDAPAQFLTVLVLGITFGSLYGLIALGYTLVYGILELINFAHGDLFMLGGLLSGSFIISVFGLQGGKAWYVLWPLLLLTLVIAATFCASLNVGIEAIAYRRLRNAPRLAPLITAVAVSFILQGVGLIFWGPRPTTTNNLVSESKIFDINGFSVTWNKLVIILVTAPVLVGLIYLVQKTRQGKAMRAVAQDMQAASMMGINVTGRSRSRSPWAAPLPAWQASCG